jgi:hypothetical protein
MPSRDQGRIDAANSEVALKSVGGEEQVGAFSPASGRGLGGSAAP